MTKRLLLSAFMTVSFGVIAVSAHAEAVPLRTYVIGDLPTAGRWIWVSPNGSDLNGAGSAEKPFLTPGIASRQAAPGDTIVIKAGTYASFGSIRRGGTPGNPVTIRPEPNAKPVFDLKDGFSGMEIAASYVRVIGLDIGQRAVSPKGHCVVVTRPVVGIEFMNTKLHHCATGVRLSQTGSSVSSASFQDVEITDQERFGVHCAPGPCSDILMRRVKFDRIGTLATRMNAAALLFEATSTRVTLEDGEVAHVDGDGVILRGSESAVGNTLIRDVTRTPLFFGRGGSLMNSEVRASEQGIVMRGGAAYRVRGNLIEGVMEDGRGYPFQVVYDEGNAHRIGTLYFAANRVVSRDGNVGFPSSASDIVAPLLTVLQSNTFFFLQPADGAELPNGMFASSTAFASATGTGIMNSGGNVSVFGAPLDVDLQSAISPQGSAEGNLLAGATLVYPGTLIKGSGPAVYLYAADGKRHAFPNETTYRSWYAVEGKSDFSGVTTIRDDAMGRIPLGKNVTYRPAARLVKVATDPKVYAVARGMELRWVKTEEAARTLFGEDWSRKVDDLPDAFFVNYVVGDPVEKEMDFDASREASAVMNPAEMF